VWGDAGARGSWRGEKEVTTTLRRGGGDVRRRRGERMRRGVREMTRFSRLWGLGYTWEWINIHNPKKKNPVRS
jgi:hypothetical protein